MEFLKKNYEKVVLAVVLLGLTIAACLLPVIISAKREALTNLIEQKPHPKELPPMDMALEDAALQRAQSRYSLDFTNKHNLLNPVLWKKLPDGRLLKQLSGNEEGVGALEVTAIKPLYLQITLGAQNGSGYMMSIERQGALRPADRHASGYVSKENKSQYLTLKEIKGPAEKPTELVLEWNETSEIISVTPDKPFRKVEAYAADLKYPLEANKVWTDKRVGSPPLMFANGSYNIVAITQSNVVVSAKSNDKKTTITFHPAN